MDGLVITYGGSKAVKITEQMRKELNDYNNRGKEIKTLVQEVNSNKILLEDKTKEMSELETKMASEDKREVKEASKQVKPLQKEIDKINKDIENTQSKIDEMTNKQNKPLSEGIIIKSVEEMNSNSLVDEFESDNTTEEVNSDDFSNEDDLANTDVINSETTEINPVETTKINPIETTEINPVETAEINPIETTEINPVETAEINPVETVDDSSEMINEFNDEFETTVNEDDKGNAVSEGADLSAELDGDFSDSEETINAAPNTFDENNFEEISDDNDVNPVVDGDMENEMATLSDADEVTPIEIETPVITSFEEEDDNDEKEFENIEEPISEEDADAIWEGLQNVELSEIPEIEESKEEIETRVHNDMVNSLPSYEAISPFISENVKNDVYETNDIIPDEEIDETDRDLKNLTLFKDYADYTFAFGQKHFKREALTPFELESLKKMKAFPTERSFYSKRATQYNKIANESDKLKKKVVTLGKDFTKKLNEISAEYDRNVKELNKVYDASFKQAEVDRVEKIQTSRLNDNLTQTIRERESEISELINKNNDLQRVIDNQNNKISELEMLNAEQAEQIRMFEEKLNTVFGIVKEVNSN